MKFRLTLIFYFFFIFPSVSLADCNLKSQAFKAYLEQELFPLVQAEVLKNKYQIFQPLDLSKDELEVQLKYILNFDYLFRCEEESPRNRQAEFSLPIWAYSHSEKPELLEKARTLLNTHSDVLESIESRYGVDKETLVSIWARETKLGEKRGDIYVVSAVSQLAFERQNQFWIDNVIYAVRIMLENKLDHKQFVGSWAGAFGHMQFIPSTYAHYAVDFDKDGRSLHWSDHPTDALASAAHYLSQLGWKQYPKHLMTIKASSSFSYKDYLQNKQPFKDLAYWSQNSDLVLPQLAIDSTSYKLFSPHGSHEIQFLVNSNFEKLKKYNNADFYALAVLLFAQKLADPNIEYQWNKTAGRILNFNENYLLQTLLNANGFPAGSPDGILGPSSTRAIMDYQQSSGSTDEVIDGFASESVFFRLVSQSKPTLLKLIDDQPDWFMELMKVNENEIKLENSPLSWEQRVKLQNELIARGHEIGSADGIIGPLSILALANELKLPADELILNRKTLRKLMNE